MKYRPLPLFVLATLYFKPALAEGVLHYTCSDTQVHITYRDTNQDEPDTWVLGHIDKPIIKQCKMKNGTTYKVTLNSVVYNDAEDYAQCNAAYYATLKIEDQRGTVYFDSKLDLADWCFNESNQPVIEDVQVFSTGYVTYDKVTHEEVNINTYMKQPNRKISGADIAGPLSIRTQMGK